MNFVAWDGSPGVRLSSRWHVLVTSRREVLRTGFDFLKCSTLVVLFDINGGSWAILEVAFTIGISSACDGPLAFILCSMVYLYGEGRR